MWRVYLVYIGVGVMSLFIIGRVVQIQYGQGDYWKKRAETLTTRSVEIQAVRGSIFDANGKMIATSVPYYEVGIDVYANKLNNEEFYQTADSLAHSLHKLFPEKSKNDFYSQLVKARRDTVLYTVLRRNVSHKELQEVKKFPLFRLGRFKGGFISVQTNKRERPFKWLAARTIGYVKDSTGRKDPRVAVGLEGAYDTHLKGISGSRLMQKIAGGVWMPVNNENEIEPQDGYDLVSTIDIDIQDVAEHALMTHLKKQNAGHGCVVLMEVATGDIKAIANLTRRDSSVYQEDFNYAIGLATDPGSTFKLMTLMAGIEDQKFTRSDTVNVGNGQFHIASAVVRDAHAPKKSRMSVQEVFEQSSNVGTAKLILRGYSKSPQKFVDRLKAMNVGAPLNLDIKGEGKAILKDTKDKSWSGTTLPWMAYGYELNITPMQTLSFYNAVANNGRMVKPRFVKELRKNGKVIKEFPVTVLKDSICSARAINEGRKLLEGVVENGTASHLKNSVYTIAGKTGTAQTNISGKYEKIYQASFVGYFPAEDPKYSCIVIINAPSNREYYGGAVAAPVFKEIADKVYATNLNIHKPINSKQVVAEAIPMVKGEAADVLNIFSALNIPNRIGDVNDFIAVNNSSSKELSVKSQLSKNIMPDLTGLSVSDVLPVLENHGLGVKILGSGKVESQSVPAGSKIIKNALITLQLQ